MTSGWHNKLARVSRMDWDEIRTRLGQELHKEGDLLRHQLGRPPAAVRLREAAEGKFFFARSEAAERAELIRHHLPDQVAEIVREADEICQHHFRLLGYENLDYGAEIDWHLDRVHGKRAPLDPWFRIPFLEFAAVGDHKIIWELNRHQHLVTLAKAWLLTRDEKYVRELMAQWRSWVKANPYPLGINWGSTLEVAFRSLSWIWVDRLISEDAGRGGGALQRDVAGFRGELLPALAFHGRYVERYLSTYFSPNTHLLGEAVAIFFLGTLYPPMPQAGRWKDLGWKILLHEAGRQVRPDGVHFEQALYYHVYALDLFLYGRRLAAANDVPIPSVYDAVLLRMLEVVETLAQAGPAEGFGDDDGGRLFNPRRNRTEHMTDPLAIGAVTYKCGGGALPRLGGAEPRHPTFAGARLTEESIWLFGEGAMTTLAQPTANRAPRSCAFSDGGLYVLADSQPCAESMMIDAGPQGVGRCGHGHADALSLRFSMNGSRWLVDSGSGVYISADPADRNAFRGTSAHNTMRVDGENQAVPDGPFSWTEIPTTCVENWVLGKTFTYFAGSHNGYARLPDPVTHRRAVLYVSSRTNGGVWLVRDTALGNAEHGLELHWHFASDVSVQEAGAREWSALRREADQPVLRLIMPEETSWKTEITRGLLSPAYGRYQSAPVVCSEARVKLPAEIATAMIAQPAATHTRETGRMASMQHAAVQVYELHDRGHVHSFIFARDKRAWSAGLWSSDAELLYCRFENEKLAHLIAIGGSSVAWRGRPLLEASRPSKFFEWRKHDDTKHSEPEPFSTTALFDELTGGSNASSVASTATSSYAEKD